MFAKCMGCTHNKEIIKDGSYCPEYTPDEHGLSCVAFRSEELRAAIELIEDFIDSMVDAEEINQAWTRVRKELMGH